MTDSKPPDYRALLKRSLVAIEQLEAKLAAVERSRTEPVAIVGIGCRFPGGVETPAAYWNLLSNGVDAVTEVPPDRWDVDAYFDADPDAPGKTYARWGGFLKQVDGFDAAFFGISRREAIGLDPQQRLLLEAAWEALEHAAIAPSSLAGSRTAVYVGISTHDYGTQLAELGGSAAGDAYTASGSTHSMASGRLSYFFGFHGPNVAIDTACSSSLVALHAAVRSLRQGEAELALAGGVNLTLTPTGAILTARARMMSFDGRCKTFDASADGYVRAEGCGIVVLKRLSDAQRDGDRILAVVRGSAVNQDGRSSGLTAPNGAAQEVVIREALADAGLSASDISVIEAHGTGTSLGDPIEINALGRVFGERDAGQPLVVGSCKTNIGHAEGAAGIAGVIKAALSLHHRTIPPHLHLREPNPLVPWASLPIHVPTVITPWTPPEGVLRRAGVSSFGFSGTNAHVILEEAPAAAAASAADERQPRLVVVSGHTSSALRDQAARLHDYLERPDRAAWRDIVFTLGQGRSHLAERLALVADSPARALELLATVEGDDTARGLARDRAVSASPEVAFLFTGQGAQFFGMARELYESQPAFTSALDACAATVDPLIGRSLIDIVMRDEAARALLDDTAFTQPALFAVEYALSQLWRSWGVEPTVLLGHSVGEYVAACLAGVFSLADGLRLIVHRGRLMSQLPRDGAMAAVFADEQQVIEALRDFEHDVSIGAVNGPANTLISGRTGPVDDILSRLKARGVEAQRLNVSHAFHSPLMEPMLDAFEQAAATVTFSPPRIGLVSNVTGRMASDEVASAAYWRRHVRDAVRFSDGIATLHDEKVRVFVEVGPSPTLLRMAQRCPKADDGAWLPSLRKGMGDTESMLRTLAELYVRGQQIDWRALAGADATRVELPTYAFQRERYWHDLTPSGVRRSVAGHSTGHPMLGDRLTGPLHIYQADVSIADAPWLADHRIQDLSLFPATGFIELALAAARQTLGDDLGLDNLSFRESLVLPEHASVTLQIIVSPGQDGRHEIEIYSAELDSSAGVEGASAPKPVWRLHAVAVAAPADAVDRRSPPQALVGEVRERDIAEHYRFLEDLGAHYGPAFRGITQMTTTGSQVLGRAQLPEALTALAQRMQLHPALLDACLQMVGAGMTWVGDGCVPVGLDRYRLYRSGAIGASCHVVHQVTDTGVRADLTLFDADGGVIAELEGMEFQRVTRAALAPRAGATATPDWLLEVDWQPSNPSAQTDGSAGRWLVLGDGGRLMARVASQLAQRTASVAVVRHGETFGPCQGGWQLDTSNRDHYRQLFEVVAQDDPRPWDGVIWLAGLDRAAPGRDLQDLVSTHRVRIGALLAATPVMAEWMTTLCLVTRGAQCIADSAVNLTEAPAWGLGGVIANEYPALRLVRVDLDPVERDDEADLLVRTLLSAGREERVAFRGSQRYVARLTPGTLIPADAQSSRRLEIDERGVLENLKWREVPRVVPGPGAVEIRVLATGLNFRDVLNALGMYPGDPGPLGNECAGVVTALGEGVDAFAVGDEVVAMVDQSFATYVVASETLIVRKPPNLTFAEAATIPVTFLTAEYALAHLSRMKAGDRVLIHAATGGVGMAAMQLARRAGATIFATAGSPAKRALARALGAHHVSDSRSLSFVEDFTRETGGEGVDIVLNSLAGEFIPSSLGLLRAGGRFVEIGKTGIWDAAAVDAQFPGLEYYPLYLGEATAADPRAMRDRLQRLMDDFAAGVLTPLPQTIYPIERAEEAFRFMGQGRHTGKIVVTQRRTPQVRADGTYLITGAFGGLGLACARGLADWGARHLVLTGRRPPSVDAQATIDALTSAGVSVTVALGDIAIGSDVAAVLERIATSLPPLRGILHVAGVVDDGMLTEQDLSRFDRVMAPKVQGTWHLHTLTRALPLEFFVMFSSGAALLGSPGQGNYAAANAFMDALASVRQAEGRHALSINWGSWSDVGMAAEVGEQHRRRWAELGLRMIRPSDGVRMLLEALQGTALPQVAILPLDRARLPRMLGPFFQRLLDTVKTSRVRETASADVLQRIGDASPEERAALVAGFLTEQLVKVLAVDRSTRLRTDQSVMEMGLDSLMAMELRNRVQTAVRIRLSVADLLTGPTVDELAGKILEAMDLGGAPVPTLAPALESTGAWEEGSL